MSKCKGCPICPYIKPGNKVRATATAFTADIEQQVNCQTRNIVYCIQCKKCCIQYIGESKRIEFQFKRVIELSQILTKPQENTSTCQDTRYQTWKLPYLKKSLMKTLNTESKESRCGLRNLIPSIRG